MRPIKRVEMIIPENLVDRVLKLLEEINITRYTVIKEAYGRGDRGVMSSEPFGLFENNYIVIACEEEEVKPIVEAVRPSLKRFGGVCLVSDAHWVIH